jgi:hypothetical protein
MPYSECYVTQLSTIHRKRTLPAPGQILCPVGDYVSADTVVAETNLATGYRLLDLDKILAARISNIDKVLLKKIGDVVQEGEPIARTRGFAKRECLAPVQGKILDARGNRVLIEAAGQHVELKAFYPGEVHRLIPARGVEIEITGALIQGVWGTGQETLGKIDVVVPDGKTALTADMINTAHMGKILVGGRTLDADVIVQAVHNQVRAVIVGSLQSALLPVIETNPVSVIITEGFGDFEMNSSAFELLHSLSGLEACFSPITQTHWMARRPEIVIPLSAEGQPPMSEHSVSLQVGARVRALRAPYENTLGEVVSLPPHRYRLESGIRIQGAEVDLQSVGKVFIPFENLEIIL